MLSNNLLQNIVIVLAMAMVISSYVPQVKNMLPEPLKTHSENCFVRLALLLIVGHLLNNNIEKMTDGEDMEVEDVDGEDMEDEVDENGHRGHRGNRRRRRRRRLRRRRRRRRPVEEDEEMEEGDEMEEDEE